MSSLWYRECSNFVVYDLREEILQLKGPGYPNNWPGKGSGTNGPRSKPPTFGVEHQTAGGTTRGKKGPLATAGFLTRPPVFKCPTCGHQWKGTPAYPHSTCPKDGAKGKNLVHGRGWPLMSYHGFVPFEPMVNENRKWVIYYCVDFNTLTWHTGGGNSGIGIAYQGRFAYRSNPYFRATPGTDGQPSAAQKAICLTIWREWITPELGIGPEQRKGHFDYGKKGCPGDYIENRIRHARGDDLLFPLEDVPSQPYQASEMFDTWVERQAALVVLGYDLGKSGPLKNGVDNDPGGKTRGAIEALELAAGIDPANGYWDADTEEAAIAAMKAGNFVREDVQEQLPEEHRTAAPTPPVTQPEPLLTVEVPEPEPEPATLEELPEIASDQIEDVEQAVDPEDPPDQVDDTPAPKRSKRKKRR